MMIKEDQLKVCKMQTCMQASNCQMYRLSEEAGTDGLWKNFSLKATKQPKMTIYSPTSWSAPVPLCTSASVRNSNICCSQMGFLLTTQMCSAYKYRSCVLQHLSGIGQKPIFQCKNRNAKLKSWKKEALQNIKVPLSSRNKFYTVCQCMLLPKETLFNFCQKSVHYWPYFVNISAVNWWNCFIFIQKKNST